MDILPMELTGGVTCKDLLLTVGKDGSQWDYANRTLLSCCVGFTMNRKGGFRTSVDGPDPDLAISSGGDQFASGTK
jgi:hypothetical protein